jgi:hypothetical protein
MRLLLSNIGGSTTGMPNNPVFAAIDGSKPRLTATVDANRNRTVTAIDAD